MLTIYRSNRAEWLASVLAEEMRLKPPGVFETAEVVVNSLPTSYWLKEHLAMVNGISAHTNFIFPGSSLRKITANLLGLDPEKKDPWRSRRLVWSILNLLPDFLKTKEASSLYEWFHKQQEQKNIISINHWQLARCIADAFDDYSIYRPLFTNQVIEGQANQSKLIDQLPTSLKWQPILLKQLSQEIKVDPFCVQVLKAIKILKNSEERIDQIPHHLRFFGLSSLAPIQVELIQALSAVIDIQIFLLTPCPELWTRCANRRSSLGDQWSSPFDEIWLTKIPRIEAILGRMGAEFQQLLEGTGETQFGEWKEGDLFAAPANITSLSGHSPSLLEQIQQNLVSNENNYSKSTKLSEEDTSLLFMACAGQRRQIQIVRDQILQWLAQDNSLEPKDIIIMTPQVNKIGPLFASVFNDSKATGVEIPWVITDDISSNYSPLITTILKLLDIAGSRLDAVNLESLLSNSVLQSIHGICSEEALEISRTLQLTGFRWGLDLTEKDAREIHTLAFCLDRWLIGLTMPNHPELISSDFVPFDSGKDDLQIAKWWDVLSSISRYIKLMQTPRTGLEWITVLRELIDKLSQNDITLEQEREKLLSAIEDWEMVVPHCNLKLEAKVVESVLNEILATKESKYGYRCGALTLCGLEPMRAIPYKIIILMGLDADIFPRYKERPGFNLLENSYLLGDPRGSDQDRYILLEAIMSSRQKLLITWNSLNEYNGERIEPSPPIQQLIAALETELGEGIIKEIFKEPALSSINRDNFRPGKKKSATSCDQRDLRTRYWLDKTNKSDSEQINNQLDWNEIHDNSFQEVSFKEILRWMQAPQLFWLEQHSIKPREWQDQLLDLEELTLDEWKRDDLIRTNFQEIVEKLSKEDHLNIRLPEEGKWTTKLINQGILPPGSGEELETGLLEERFQNLQKELLKYGEIKTCNINLKGDQQTLLLAGDTIIQIEYGQLNHKSVMKGWFKHLTSCTYLMESRETVVISRNTNKNKINEYKSSIKWLPLTTEEAKKHIDALAQLTSNGKRKCWPIPPRSGWELALKKSLFPQKTRQAFNKVWEGSNQHKGERELPEMKICFGEKCDTSSLLDSSIFQEAFLKLYDPIIKNFYR